MPNPNAKQITLFIFYRGESSLAAYSRNFGPYAMPLHNLSKLESVPNI